MKWIKSGDYTSIGDVILKNSKSKESDLVNPEKTRPQDIYNLGAAADIIRSAIAIRKPIIIVGDYDADGITATAILTKLLRFLCVEPQAIIPKRFTDGYGIPHSCFPNAPESLVITVDNGISAVEEITYAKALNHQVIIIDHHLPGADLPPADVIVDPHIAPDKNAFINYCGAGLAYKLAEMMLDGSSAKATHKLRHDLTVLACIGTIADCVELKGDNRRIVMDGLKIMNDCPGDLSAGLKLLVMASSSDNVDEDFVGYQIAPLLNAPGRLYNAGGSSVLKALLNENISEGAVYLQKMQEINDRRKSLQNEWYDKIKKRLINHKKSVIVAHEPEIPEGIIGIVAGKLSEEFKAPVFVFTNSREPGILKGSGRTYGDINIKSLLDSVEHLTLRSGGHEGAAGVSIHQDKINAFREALEASAPPSKHDAEEMLYYDIELKPEDVPLAWKELKKYAPFGAGVPKPVVVIKNFNATVYKGSHYRLMGKSNEHLKIFSDVCNAIGFNMGPQYNEMGNPSIVDILGFLNENTYNGITTIQIMASGIRLNREE